MIGLVILFATLLFAPSAASAATQWVSLTGSVGGNTSCSSPGFIGVPGAQDAMNAASSGDTVHLCPGTWNTAETTTGGGFGANQKTLTIEGSGETETIIDGSGRTSPAIVLGSSDTSDSLTVKDLTIQNAVAEDPSAISTNVSLTIEDARIQNNGGSNGAVGMLGTGGNLTIRGSELTGQAAGTEYPTPLVVSAGPTTLEDSTFADNFSPFPIAGVYVGGPDGTDISVESSTFSGLISSTGGDEPLGCTSALLNISDGADAGISINNSTFTDNIAGTYECYSAHIASEGFLTMKNSTFAGNSGVRDNGGIPWGDLLSFDGMTLANNIIVGDPDSPATCASFQGDATNLGGNVISDETLGCDTFVGGASPSLQAKVPSSSIALDPLALNAPGTTETMALGAGSVARGAAISAECPATDQRGVARPAGACDSGAYQTEDPGPTPSGKPKLKLSIRTPKKVKAGKGFGVTVKTSNVAQATAARAVSASSATTATEVKTCAKLPKRLFVVKRGGGKVKGRTICWTRSSLPAGKSVTYKVTVRSSKASSGSARVNGTASATNDSGATVKASGSDRTRIVKPRTPKPEPPTG